MPVVRTEFCSECGHSRRQHTPTGCTECECPMKAPKIDRRSDGTEVESWGRGSPMEPFGPNNPAFKSHGISSLLRADRTASAGLLAEIDAQYEVLAKELPFIHQVDRGEMRRLAELDITIRHLSAYIDEVLLGEARVYLKGAPKDQPRTGIEALAASNLPELLSKLTNTASNVAERLGLNPAGRHKLLKDYSWAKHLSRDMPGPDKLIQRGTKRLEEMRRP